jgi:hypothetical protein
MTTLGKGRHRLCLSLSSRLLKKNTPHQNKSTLLTETQTKALNRRTNLKENTNTITRTEEREKESAAVSQAS